MSAARFFAYDAAIEGFRFIELTADDPVVESFASGKTDEGWWSTWERWELDGNTVYRSYGDDGADCDGRMSTRGDDSCALSTLAVEVPFGYTVDTAPFLLPRWESGDRSRRDYSAEAAGY